jgi:hypothetical protein
MKHKRYITGVPLWHSLNGTYRPTFYCETHRVYEENWWLYLWKFICYEMSWFSWENRFLRVIDKIRRKIGIIMIGDYFIRIKRNGKLYYVKKVLL